ncbi:MAG TPA: methanogenesis marker 2 protein [Euryarchaeota archaeon]|nr:methanogenesis marker 2 protein [Euryarchaeota archaeon]
MDLAKLAADLRGYEGVIRKNGIGSVAREMGLADVYGDDAAIVKLDGKTLLFACDSINEGLIEADPYFAGYSAVLVNVNDIAAMGGKPVALVNVLSSKDETVAQMIARGVGDAARKFAVPVVGGHFNPNSSCNGVAVSILGEAGRGDIIKGSNAEPGDVIIATIDLDGITHPRYELAWDSTSSKSAETVQRNLGLLRILAKQKLVKSCRDISSPGLIGTLGMLLEASGVGGTVDLEKIPCPKGVAMSHWLKVYPGYGFIFTAEKSRAQGVIKMFQEQNISASVIGLVDDTKKLILSYQGDEEVVFDFNRQSITGVR